MAVSPESITAEVPSRIAFATSLTSARVGRGLRSIESSIWVAVMTGFPLVTVVRMMFFWIAGTSASGNSTPRSPRATMVPSAAATMLSRFATAARLSIFAMMGMVAPSSTSIPRSAMMSSSVCTNEAAM